MEKINLSLESYNNFKDLKIHEFFKNCKSFDDIFKYLGNKNVLNKTSKYIKSLNKIINYDKEIINSRIFLCIYTIRYFTKDVLSDIESLSKMEKELYDLSIYITDYIDNYDCKLMMDICNLIKLLNKFKRLFNIWKQNDKDSQIKIYIQIYLKYKKQLETAYQKYDSDFIKYIKDIMKKSKNYVIKLSNVDNFEKLVKNTKIKEISIDKSLEPIIKNNLEIAFWKLFYEDISKDEPNFYQIIGLVKNINEFLSKIYKNNRSKLDYINDVFDPVFLKNLIDSNLYNLDKLLNFTKFLLNEINEIDSMHFDKINRKLYKELENNEKKCENIVSSLKFAVNRLDTITDLIEQYNSVKN